VNLFVRWKRLALGRCEPSCCSLGARLGLRARPILRRSACRGNAANSGRPKIWEELFLCLSRRAKIILGSGFQCPRGTFLVKGGRGIGHHDKRDAESLA